MRQTAFTTPAGDAVELITLTAGGFQARILSLGASIADLIVPVQGIARSVVLGLGNLADYVEKGRHMGAVAGRCANRIADGRFTLDGKAYQLPMNERAVTHLHGGHNGFGRRVWTVEMASETRVVLSIESPDGEEGYPGHVRARCVYSLTPEGVLSIALTADTTAPTLVNLATHSYFNLSGDPDILGHRLTISAEHYTPVDARLIPTGEIAAVAGTGFDFRQPARIGEQRARTATGFDHNYATAAAPSADPRFVARLESPSGDLALDLWSTEPGVQFYDGQYLPDAEDFRGRRSAKYAGCCLEPQRFPDAINHPAFPSAVLRPGEIYRQVTEYRFTR
jgi:aldose 1-epimerase